MEFSIANIALSIGTGLLSVASPCILPVIPIIMTGTEQDHKLRPLLITIGISITFIVMGVITSAFGSLITGKMQYLEKISGIIIIIFGILMLFDANIFKKITVFSKFQNKSKGPLSGLIIGLTLGLIWIPCIGPLLSSILAMVATKGQIGYGVFFLALYSIGFSIPILIAGYSSQLFRSKVSLLQKHPLAIRIASGVILIAFGVYIATKGLVGFNL